MAQNARDCRTTHPYRWMTIGKELSHIENAKRKM